MVSMSWLGLKDLHMCINNAYSDKYKALLQLKTKTEPNKTKLKENLKLKKVMKNTKL